MSLEENKRIARRFILDVYGKLDESAAREVIAEDLRVHGRTPPPALGGPGGQLLWARAISKTFGNPEYSVDVLVAEDDLVVDHWSLRGTHVDTFNGIEATGRPVTMTGMDICRDEGGKIIELWHEIDIFGTRMQLASPSPG